MELIPRWGVIGQVVYPPQSLDDPNKAMVLASRSPAPT
jgi:hypothetical protein